MGFLGSFDFSFVFFEKSRPVIFSVIFNNQFFGRKKRLAGKIQRISAVISDETPFIKVLGESHGHFGRPMESLPGRLLQGASSERRQGIFFRFFFFNRRYFVFGVF